MASKNEVIQAIDSVLTKYKKRMPLRCFEWVSQIGLIYI